MIACCRSAKAGEASEGPQIAELAAWPSEGAMNSGLGFAQAVGAAKA